MELHGMDLRDNDGRTCEPRIALWALAEVWWEDPAGKPLRAAATLEDTSLSGACIRLKTPITIGARLTVKWHREQFCAVARNCRSDGREFLLGVRREPAPSITKSTAAEKVALASDAAHDLAPVAQAGPQHTPTQPKMKSIARRSLRDAASVPIAASAPAPASDNAASRPKESELQTYEPRASEPRRTAPVPRAPSQPKGSSPPPERNAMPHKKIFSKFWQRQQEVTDAPDQSTPTEAPVKPSHAHSADSLTGSPSNLLSYEDIYHAAGILNPRSGYGVHKVVDMLNSDRIRELSKDIKRASVLMALDAAGTSPDDLLRDATQRQQALDSYEAGQQKQLEEFEARKAQENAKIQAELDRVTAHYAERIKQNHDQVVREKEALRGWQMAKQYESQRISEVIELCAKQPAPASVANPQPPAANASTIPGANVQPNQSAKATAGH
jgi:hypothetical protein